MGARKNGAELGHLVARHETGLHGAGELAAVARLSPLVAEQLAARHGLRLGLRLARAVGAEHVEVDARAQVLDTDHRLVARRHAGDDVAGQRVLTRARLPAEFAGKLAGRLGIWVEADPRPVLRGGEAAGRP